MLSSVRFSVPLAEPGMRLSPHRTHETAIAASGAPISGTVIDRRNNNKYDCQTGWAEGSLWLQGQGCRRS